jgi:hypothetical protein
MIPYSEQLRQQRQAVKILKDRLADAACIVADYQDSDSLADQATDAALARSAREELAHMCNLAANYRMSVAALRRLESAQYRESL